MPGLRERLRYIKLCMCCKPQDDEEPDKYVNDISKQTSILSDPNSFTFQKVAALKNIGLSSFTSGKHFKSTLNVVLPLLVEIINDKESEEALVIGALQTLATAALRLREVKAVIEDDTGLLKRLIALIDESKILNISRWSCYCLLLALVDDYDLKVKLRDYDGLHKILAKAANHPRPWVGWGCNAAEVILKIIGLRDVDAE